MRSVPFLFLCSSWLFHLDSLCVMHPQGPLQQDISCALKRAGPCNAHSAHPAAVWMDIAFVLFSAAQQSSTSHNIIMLIQLQQKKKDLFFWHIIQWAQRCFLEKVLNANCLLSERARPRALYSPPFFQLHKWSMNESRKYAGASCKWGVLVYGCRAADVLQIQPALGVDARVYGVFRSVPTLVTLSRLRLHIAWKSAAARKWCRPQLRLRHLWFFVGLMGQMHS